jgi:HEAT repeat protein
MFGVSVEKVEKWGEKGKVGKLVSVLSNSKVKKDVYLAAIKALGKCEKLDRDAVNLLITIMRNSDKDIKLATIRTLGDIGDPLAVEHIRYLLNNDEDSDVKAEAEKALKKIAS